MRRGLYLIFYGSNYTLLSFNDFFRGLLLPKIVVDDFGGERTDPGSLGAGIYFASSVRYVVSIYICYFDKRPFLRTTISIL